MSDLQLPIVHLNGTGAMTLLDGYVGAYLATKDAIEAVRKIEFNARDYYPAGPGAWDKAVAQRQALLQSLQNVVDELEAHAVHVQEIMERSSR